MGDPSNSIALQSSYATIHISRFKDIAVKIKDNFIQQHKFMILFEVFVRIVKLKLSTVDYYPIIIDINTYSFENT